MPSFEVVARRRHWAATRTLEGEGFEVRRAVPNTGLEAVGPFIFLDHFGPISIEPGQAKGAPDHPHAGIETLSYLLEGRSQHKDSLGNASAMGPGEVQWMRAGRGIRHDEGPDAELRRVGGRVHGFQFWINMPRGHKHDDPEYRHFTAAEIPLIESGGARIKVIAGELLGEQGPVVTFGSPLLAHVELAGGGHLQTNLPGGEAAVYVATGAALVDGNQVQAGHLVSLAQPAVALAAIEAADVILLGGAPLDAPIVRHGPFVMNSRAEIAQAVADYQAGRMGRIAH